MTNQPRIRVYDLRHAAATLWIRSGVALGEAARRLGHSVETLVSTYIGAMEGDEAGANALLDAAVPLVDLTESASTTRWLGSE